jgi:hypothetical protein
MLNGFAMMDLSILCQPYRIVFVVVVFFLDYFTKGTPLLIIQQAIAQQNTLGSLKIVFASNPALCYSSYHAVHLSTSSSDNNFSNEMAV